MSLSAGALAYLVERLAPGGRVVRYRPLRGGVSASTYAVQLERANRTTRQAIVVRMLAAPWHRRDPQGALREFKVLEELARFSFPAPKPLLVVENGSFGAPTVVATRVPGTPVLRTNNVHTYVRQLAAQLVELHRIPTDCLGFLPDQVTLLSKALNNRSRAEDPLERRIREVALQLWPEVSKRSPTPALVHGDYCPGNVLWHRGRLSGVVDWEDARLGDPARDVAICRGDLTLLFGLHVADAFLREYETAAGRQISDMPFWDLLTCTLALPEVELWVPGWNGLGRSDLTVETARERFHTLARAALARIE